MFRSWRGVPQRLKWLIIADVIVIFALAAFVLPGGQDLDSFYHFASGCLSCVNEPPFASWILAFLNLTGDAWRWPFWTVLISVLLVWSSRNLGGDPLWVILSFPAMAQIWLGQLDGFITLGTTMAVTFGNPYLRGLGLLLMAMKPQVAAPAILLLFWYERERLKVAAIPVAVALLSFVVWGIDWPVRWAFHSEPAWMNEIPWRVGTLFPIGLLAFAVIPLLADKKSQIYAAFLASALGLPFYGSYSYVTFLVLSAPWWSTPLSYAWVLAYPWLGRQALQFAWVLPLVMLAHLVWTRSHVPQIVAWRERVQRVLP